MSQKKPYDPQAAAAGIVPEREEKHESPGPENAEGAGTAPRGFREASYVVLFIAAVFVINAMETGSYRTPWPVALGTASVGIGLFVYSWYLKLRSGK